MKEQTRTKDPSTITMTPFKSTPMSSESPSSSTAASAVSPSIDTPVAAEPSPLQEAFGKVVYFEGIPEHLGQKQHASSPRNNKQQTPAPPGFDDGSLESVLSSLDDDEALSLDESYYFTPVEERPCNRLEKLKRELQLRSELLQILARGQPAAYVEQLTREEETVQQWTLACALQRNEDRARRKVERRRQRQLQKQQQEQDQQQDSPASSPIATPTSTPTHNSIIGRRPTAQEAVAPKSLKSLFEPSPTRSPLPPPDQPFAPPTPTTQNRRLFSYWDFEWYHGLPAVVSLLISCVAHVALYELVLAVVLAAMQPFLQYRILVDSEDNILPAAPGSARVEDACYSVVLIVGLMLARMSGLLFSFSKKHSQDEEEDNEEEEEETDNVKPPPRTTTIISPQERHLDPRRVDRQLSQWMHYNKTGRLVKGMLDMIGFYVCFVAIMYFLGRFALCLDQRALILEGMPSNMQHHDTHQLIVANTTTTMHSINGYDSSMDVGTCPSHVNNILLPSMREEEGDDSESSSSSDDESDSDDSDDDDERQGELTFSYEWSLPECADEHYEDDHGNEIIYESGPEDEAYLFQHLSASAYHQFWGHGYRAAMFDLPHQLFFNLACSVVAIYTLKRYFGCSFWEDW